MCVCVFFFVCLGDWGGGLFHLSLLFSEIFKGGEKSQGKATVLKKEDQLWDWIRACGGGLACVSVLFFIVCTISIFCFSFPFLSRFQSITGGLERMGRTGGGRFGILYHKIHTSQYFFLKKVKSCTIIIITRFPTQSKKKKKACKFEIKIAPIYKSISQSP